MQSRTTLPSYSDIISTNQFQKNEAKENGILKSHEKIKEEKSEIKTELEIWNQVALILEICQEKVSKDMRNESTCAKYHFAKKKQVNSITWIFILKYKCQNWFL